MPTKQERLDLLHKVLRTDDPMNRRDLFILRIYQHTAGTVKTLRKELGDILEKFNETEDICWEFLGESVTHQKEFGRYRREFRASLDLTVDDYRIPDIPMSYPMS